MSSKNRIKRKHRLKKIIERIKTSSSCVRCKENDPSVLTFHHVIPDDKKYDIRDMYNYSIRSIMKEINRCVIMCRKCHDLEHKL